MAGIFTRTTQTTKKSEQLNMKKLSIGWKVEFILANVRFVGQIMDIKGPWAYIAVLGYGDMFMVSTANCIPL